MTGQTSKTRLQRERLKHQWTQAEIAEKVGVDPKTFGRWERGEQVANLTMRRVLSKLLGEEVDRSWFLGSDETEEVSEALWLVPYSRNPYFTDENQKVEHLRTLLTAEEEKVTHQVAISGLGGIGKTQLALEYAYRYRDCYQAVFWVRAGSQVELLEDLMQIAHQLQITKTGRCEEKPQHLVNQIRSWLQVHREWLLILDNAEEDLGNQDVTIAQLLSIAQSGHVLLTTRAQSVASVIQNVLLDNISPEEGARFLLHRSGLPLSDSFQLREGALDLARLLGGLPLALEQAAAYIQETRCGLAGYQQVYEMSHKDILQTKVTYKRLYTDYSESVATTWLISFRRVEQQSALASDLLKLFAYLTSDAIPVQMIIQGTVGLNEQIYSMANIDMYLLNAACRVLLNYSLIKRSVDGTLFSLHRLVQVVLQDAMESDAQYFWAKQAIQIINKSFETAASGEMQQYIPHARASATLIKTFGLQDNEIASLLEMTAKTLYEKGWYAQARPLFLRAYNTLKKNDSHAVSLLRDLAHVHVKLGIYPWAITAYRRIIDKLEQNPGATRPEIVTCLHQIALAQLQAGFLPDARQTYHDLLLRSKQEASPGDERQQAMMCSIAAQIAEESGLFAQAEWYYQQALDIREQFFGEEHLEVAKSANALGVFYLTCANNLEQAEIFLQRALEIQRKMLNQEHPDIAETLTGLALLAWERDQYQEATELYRQALVIRQRMLGPYHPGVLRILHALLEMAIDLHKNEEVEPYFREVQAIAPYAGGTRSLQYLLMLKSYAEFLREQRRPDEALPYQEQIATLERRIAMRGSLYTFNLSPETGEEESSAWIFTH